MKLKGRSAIVTGATSGIGRATALRFGAEGASVAITGRRADRLSAVASQIRKAGGVALELRADHSRPEDNQRVVDETVKTFGGLEILVNAAGVIGNDGILNAKPEEWRRIMDINLEAVYDLTRKAAPHLIKRRGGSILNLSSVCSLRPYGTILAYCVSKAAIDMFTKCLALELAPHGVRVNAINPGVVVTELHTVSNAVPDYEAFLERSKQTHPLGRPGKPEEIANLALFLVSPEAEWITGGVHSIDGGRALTSAR
ncbi:MAG TPA: glucose 1-dehydrogenase [Planctomycetota bacterium]|nr:glucose 1-dehydrogenase [Planctomycetota bacterium]